MDNLHQSSLESDRDSLKSKLFECYEEIKESINFKSKLIVSLIQSINSDNSNLFKKGKKLNFYHRHSAYCLRR